MDSILDSKSNISSARWLRPGANPDGHKLGGKQVI